MYDSIEMANMTILADKPLSLLVPPQSKQADPSKPENDFVGAASEMCLVHNFLIRGYNSIFLQAPHVKPEDYSDFINYSMCWLNLIRSHHDGEERLIFPEIEKATGDACMQENVKQHGIFHDGLDQTRAYLEKSKKDTRLFSGAELNKILESYGETLHQHLSDEIPSLLALEKYGDKIPIKAVLNKAAQEVMGACPLTTDLSAAWVMIDKTFEGGLYKSFPPAPFFVQWGLRHVFPRWNKSWWRFAPCGWNGKPKPLYAVSS